MHSLSGLHVARPQLLLVLSIAGVQGSRGDLKHPRPVLASDKQALAGCVISNACSSSSSSSCGRGTRQAAAVAAAAAATAAAAAAAAEGERGKQQQQYLRGGAFAQRYKP
jgi:hypothetical protein